MNIDEVESGKGLRFLQTGHWTQDVVDKIKELNNLSRWHYQQRRVRARRERNKRFEERLKNLSPNGRVSHVKRGQRNYYRVVISEKDLVPWQL